MSHGSLKSKNSSLDTPDSIVLAFYHRGIQVNNSKLYCSLVYLRKFYNHD